MLLNLQELNYQQLDTKSYIDKASINMDFKAWYDNCYHGKKVPPMKKLIEFFTNEGYRIVGEKIYGLKHKSIADIDESSDST